MLDYRIEEFQQIGHKDQHLCAWPVFRIRRALDNKVIAECWDKEMAEFIVSKMWEKDAKFFVRQDRELNINESDTEKFLWPFIGKKVYYAGTNPKSFRPQEYALIIRIEWIEDKACFRVRYADGYEDSYPVSDTENYKLVGPKEIKVAFPYLNP
jgi:hypothetical protein